MCPGPRSIGVCSLWLCWLFLCPPSLSWPQHLLGIVARWTVNLLSAAHELAWTQYPAIWLCESCAILWLVMRAVRSPCVRIGVLLMLCGLVLNALVTEANAGAMPVVGMPSTLRPVSPMWRVATSNTRFPLLADQARLGLFSVGDLALLPGGTIIVAFCFQRTLKMQRRRTALGSRYLSPGRPSMAWKSEAQLSSRQNKYFAGETVNRKTRWISRRIKELGSSARPACCFTASSHQT